MLGELHRTKNVAWIFAGGDGGNFEIGGQFGGQIFQAVHGEVDTVFDQGFFDFLGEHALGADFRQRHVGDFIAGGLDDLEFHGVALRAKQIGDVMGLPESELRAAGADAQAGHQFRVLFCRRGRTSQRQQFFVFLFVVQVEEAPHKFDDGGGFGIARRGFQGADGGMHDLVDDAARQRFDGKFLVGGHGTEAAANAINFGLANGFEVVLQADDGRNHVERLQARVEFFDLAIDDRLRLFRFLLAIGDVRTDRLLQIVDVIDKDAIDACSSPDRRRGERRYR